MPHISILALLLSLGALAHAEKPCTQPDLHAPAQRAKALQSQLLAAKVANQGTDDSVPLSLQLEIHALKDTLAALATVALECAPANTGSAALQTTCSCSSTRMTAKEERLPVNAYRNIMAFGWSFHLRPRNRAKASAGRPTTIATSSPQNWISSDWI